LLHDSCGEKVVDDDTVRAPMETRPRTDRVLHRVHEYGELGEEKRPRDCRFGHPSQVREGAKLRLLSVVIVLAAEKSPSVIKEA